MAQPVKLWPRGLRGLDSWLYLGLTWEEDCREYVKEDWGFETGFKKGGGLHKWKEGRQERS